MGFRDQGMKRGVWNGKCWKEWGSWNEFESIHSSMIVCWRIAFLLFHRPHSILFATLRLLCYLKQLKVKEFSASASEYRNKYHKRAGSSHSCRSWLCGGSNHRKTLSHTIYNDYSSCDPSLAYCLRRTAVNCWRQFGHRANKWSGIHGWAMASPS